MYVSSSFVIIILLHHLKIPREQVQVCTFDARFETEKKYRSMKRFTILFYSLASYVIGLAVVAYYASFLIDAWVPKTINSGSYTGLKTALGINLLLLILFSLQHSLMARQGFKTWLKNHIPEAAERSTYILMSSVVLALVCYFWQPMPQVIFDLSGTWAGTLLYGFYALGWFVGLFSTFLIDHFDLFGLKQAWYNMKGRDDFQYRFQTPLFYKLVRHPIYTGWLMIHWFTPVMTVGHLIFACFISIYIVVAIEYEEKDLIEQFGDKYLEYVRNIPKLIPIRVNRDQGDEK
jgi:methanethiol S-methyltransferase